jgi:hypothetical protein
MSGVMGKTAVSGINEVQVYAGMFTGAAGSLQGTLTLTEVLDTGNYNKNKISGALTWVKPYQGTVILPSAMDRRTYGDGFGSPTPLSLDTDGGRYFDPVTLPLNGPSSLDPAIFAGMRPVASNAKLDFTVGTLSSIDPDVIFRITAPSVIPAATYPTSLIANPAAVTLTINGPTGVFTGKMTLTEVDDFGKTFTRNPTFFGIVTRPAGDSPVVNSYPSLEAKGTLLIEKKPYFDGSAISTVGPTGNGAIESQAMELKRNI